MLRRRRAPTGPVPLGDAVRGAASCPCASHHESLVAALLAADELILQVTASSEPLQADGGRPGVAQGEEIQVATATAPNGRTFLLVFTDLDAASARSPEGSFLGVGTQTALRMGVADGKEGLLVSASGADEVIVTAEGVARLLGEA